MFCPPRMHKGNKGPGSNNPAYIAQARQEEPFSRRDKQAYMIVRQLDKMLKRKARLPVPVTQVVGFRVPFINCGSRRRVM